MSVPCASSTMGREWCCFGCMLVPVCFVKLSAFDEPHLNGPSLSYDRSFMEKQRGTNRFSQIHRCSQTLFTSEKRYNAFQFWSAIPRFRPRSKWHCATVDHVQERPFLYHVRHSAQEESGWNFLVSLDEELDLATEADGTDEHLEDEVNEDITPVQQRHLLRAHVNLERPPTG